jgi:hypothetical protein
MGATKADTDLLDPTVVLPRKESLADEEDDVGDPLAPARGVALGMALGLVSIAAAVVLGWWLL